MLDIDRLKLVNDTYGHAAGDDLLSSVAAACQGALRDGDIMGRMGGDEFCVLLPSAGRDEARRIAERLRSVSSDCSPKDGMASWHATVSVGLATLRGQADETFSGLLDEADRALYLAKDGGRNRVAEACSPEFTPYGQ